MSDETNEVSVSITGALDTATNSGHLTAKTKSRFISAADHLLGSIFDFPAVWIDSHAERVRHEAKLKREFREAQAARLKAALEANDEALARYLRLSAPAELREFERTMNLTFVVHQAATLLPPPEQPPANEKRSENEAVEPDWLNRFRQYASEASSEELRLIWARVLAGETRSPGSFSATALRFLAEVDRSLAEQCQRVSEQALGDAVYISDADKKGSKLVDALALQAAGLLVGVGGNLGRTFAFGDEEFVTMVGRKYGLRIVGNPGATFRLECYNITQLGLEIFSLLEPRGDERERLRAFASSLPKGPIRGVSLAVLGERTGGRVLVISEETIF